LVTIGEKEKNKSAKRQAPTMRGPRLPTRVAAAAALLAVGCLALLAITVRGRAGVGRAELVHKAMSMQEAIAAAKKLQRAHAVTSAYSPQPKIQSKHAQHRAAAAAAAAAADASAPAPAPAAGRHVTDMTANQVADGTDVVFHDFNAKAYSSADAEGFAEMKKDSSSEATRAAAPPQTRSSTAPRPKDYARGLIVEPGHTQWDRVPAAAAPEAARTRVRAPSSSTPSQIPSAAAQAQIYNNDQGVKVVTGTEGDDVASGMGGSVGGQEWVRQRQARIAAARGHTAGEEAPAAHQKAKNIAKQHPHRQQTPRRRAPAASRAAPGAHVHPRNFDNNFDNDAGVKQVQGTEGDNVASGMGGGIDGAKWVAARKSRIAQQGGVQSPIGPDDAGANTLQGEVAYPGDQSVPSGRHEPTAEDIARVVGTNIVFHDIKNEGGIARGVHKRQIGIRYNDREMY